MSIENLNQQPEGGKRVGEKIFLKTVLLAAGVAVGGLFSHAKAQESGVNIDSMMNAGIKTPSLELKKTKLDSEMPEAPEPIQVQISGTNQDSVYQAQAEISELSKGKRHSLDMESDGAEDDSLTALRGLQEKWKKKGVNIVLVQR